MSRRTLPENVAKRFAWLAAISVQNKQSLYEERTAKWLLERLELIKMLPRNVYI